MILSKNDINRIYFLTRTSLPVKRIENIALYIDDINMLIDRIIRLHNADLDRDWALYDFEYKNGKSIYAKNKEIINEKDIFRGTYIHKCKNGQKYLIQITEKSGYCKKCDTQFFPELWWEHPLKDKLSYQEIKYGIKIQRHQIQLDEEYSKKLLHLGVDHRILENAKSVIHSPYEIEKMLNTKYYDWNNPPPPSKIHSKLIMLSKVWKIKPVINLGIHPDTNYFFHRCNDNTERIIFQEKHFYPWCRGCFTKFIPQWDKKTIKLYKEHITVNGYTEKDNEAKRKKDKKIKIKKAFKSSNEFFYLSILGLNERCSISELNETFRKMSKIYHPDFGGDSKMFQKIVKAKKWLFKFYKYSISNRKK